MITPLSRYKMFMCPRLRIFSSIQRNYASSLESKYTDSEKEKILRILNDDISSLPRYDITKVKVKKLTNFLEKYGEIKTLNEIETIDGFTEKTTTKLFKSLLNGPQENENFSKKIKGQILHPTLSENNRQSCKTILAVYVTVNSICWSLIHKQDYVLDEWQYHGIDYPDGKKMQMTDILNMAWTVTKKMPNADLYVMKAEATTLRATGSDPNNPKVLGINLQKAQLVAMIVALLNAKNYSLGDVGSNEDSTQSDHLKQRVYFLRPTLPFRLKVKKDKERCRNTGQPRYTLPTLLSGKILSLHTQCLENLAERNEWSILTPGLYGTLVGNERVSTDQTVEEILRESSSRKSDSHVFVSENLVNEYRNLKELQKDMLGQCLLLALTFMDICIYKNKESIKKLLQRGE